MKSESDGDGVMKSALDINQHELALLCSHRGCLRRLFGDPDLTRTLGMMLGKS
jgi:hypothetical protein